MQEQATLSPKDRADYETFKRGVLKKTGIDLNLYKEQQMHRRLLSMVERSDARSFEEYFSKIEHNPDELSSFLDRMTINVSELFRNPEKWEQVRDALLKPKLKLGKPLKIWSAGCSFGAEPYTLAMMLDDLSPGVRHTLMATDIDQKILAKAKKGIYTEADVKNVPPAFKTKYLVQNGAEYQVTADLRARVTFKQHNLLADRFEQDVDLICCRNVVIYFTDDAKDKLFGRFCNALKVGGVLFVGGTERIFNHKESGFETKIPFFYERAR